WAVLTSLIVTQMSLGRSIKVASDYLMGTLAGVAYGGALAILIPHDSEWALFAVLALAIAPLAFIVSFLVFPSRAHALTTDAAADTLELVAEALSQLLEHHCGGDRPDIRRINAEIAAFLTKLNATGAEAEHERTARLTSGPDTGPLLRTLLRLRHDIVIL